MAPRVLLAALLVVAASAPAGSAAAKPTATKKAPTGRQRVAGTATVDDAALGAESAELRSLAAAERELFLPALPASQGYAWPKDLPSPLQSDPKSPRVHASGLPPEPVPSSPPAAEGGKDLAWLGRLQMPELSVRWDPRVVRYLEFFKDDPRGRSLLTLWHRRAGKYREIVRRTFKKKGVPEELVWLAMIESAFDEKARSPVGALGLWQFMPETGRLYGLPNDRWVDQRMNPVASTEAAADFLLDLQRRFGSWELAMAGYNMGYGGLLSVVRRYNTNDYWALARLEGALPWETTLYVPKILAAAIVAKNPEVFGLDKVVPDGPFEFDVVEVAPAVPLATVARAAGANVQVKDLERLNPELRAARTPPLEAGATTPVRVPLGTGDACALALAKQKKGPGLERYIVKFGETVEQVASQIGTPVARLVELNALLPGEVLRGGTVLLVPPRAAPAPASSKASSAGSAFAAKDDRATVVVPQDTFVYPDRKRVFYRVLVGDSLAEIAARFKVGVDDLRRWNDVDPAARLVEGMTLQVFVPEGTDLSGVRLLAENEVRVVPTGSEEFFERFEDKGRKRVVVEAREGDTLETVGKRHGISAALMERINRKGRRETLGPGDPVVLWLPPAAAAPAKAKGAPSGAPAPSAGGDVVVEAMPPAAPAPAPLPALP